MTMIGDLRDRLFRTIDGLEAGTISNEIAAGGIAQLFQITVLLAIARS